MKIKTEESIVTEYEIVKIITEGDTRIDDAVKTTTAEVESVIKRLGAVIESVEELERVWQSWPEAIRQLYPEHVQAFFREGKPGLVKKLLNA